MTLQVRESMEVQAGHFDSQQIAIIKDTICKGASDSELQFFLQVCKRTGLDPFSKQIYSIPRGGQRTIQVGIDGLCLIADRTGKYMPGKESVFSYAQNGGLISCTAYIKKQAKDGSWHEVNAVAFWDEYNANQGLWKKMPHRMLEKCALALCLRKAFPSDLSGLYTHEEMEQADNVKQLYTKPAVQKVSQSQADELHQLYDFCDPAHAEKVWVYITKCDPTIDSWADVPAASFERLKASALANPRKEIEQPRSMDEVAQEEQNVFEVQE